MRVEFFGALEKQAESDEDIVVLTGDLGYKLFDSFKAKYPNRFYDVGIAESNMVGLAAGLSLNGKNVYCYSITPFLVMRAFEQIRIDIAYQNLNVRLVGVGGGVAYGLEGITHFGLEDFALMRTLPNMCVVAPAGPLEARALANSLCDYKGPVYIRLGQNSDPSVYDNVPEFEIGKAAVLSEGKGIAIFAIGSMVYTGKELVNKLAKEGINVTLVNVHTLKPLDTETIIEIASKHENVFSLEEHSVYGGLGSAIAEVLIETQFNGTFNKVAIPDDLGNHIGRAGYLREKYGLTTEKIYEKIKAVLNKS